MTTVSLLKLPSFADPEALEISMRVSKEPTLTEHAQWVGPPDADICAVQIHLFSIGFTLHTQNLPFLGDVIEGGTKLAKWFTKAI